MELSNKRLIVFHPTGNSNVRSLLDGLLKSKLSFHFYTSIATFKGNIWNYLEKIPGLSDFGRRKYDSGLKKITTSYPFKEIGRMISLKVGLNHFTRHETGYFSVDKCYHYLDNSISKKLRKSNVQAVYAYEDGALHSFSEAKKHNILCLYDLPIGYWRAMRIYLDSELKSRPEWEKTMRGFLDSPTKTEKKDVEIALASHIFVASSFTKKTLEYFPGKLPPIHVVPYGFPRTDKCKSYRATFNRKINLLFVGGLSQRKGIAQLLEAANQLKDLIDLKVVGRKPVDDCKVLNESLKQVNWIPSLDHDLILQEMRAADIFVFPSLFEGYGLVIVEAMAQGTPVITTNRTCGADFIEHNINGWILEEINTPTLTKLLLEIIENPGIIEKVGKSAFKTASQNPYSNYGQEMAKIITEIIDSDLEE